MGLTGRMIDLVEVWERTPETDTWTRVTGVSTLAAWIAELTPDGRRRQSALPEPDVTHIGRAGIHDAFVGGRRLRRTSDDKEWVIKSVRRRDWPRPGHLVLILTEEEPALP